MTSSFIAATLLACAAADTTTVTLHGVTVTGQNVRQAQMRTSQNVVSVSREYLEKNLGGSLMQTLSAIPGIGAKTIGSGQSKPVIRGLGFNRVVVAEDGIKHEGQQWGDDHGLEIDQFAIDRVELVKGPAALLHGSDAIGGVLSLYTNHVPTQAFSGTAQFFGRTDNGQIGISAKVGGRHRNFFYRANATFIDYADYRVPADSIQYYSYWIRLRDGRLRNTAGCERDGSITLGYAGYNFHTDLRISESYAASGFFADAHGLEVRLSDIDYDRSRRDIDLPRQWVNHLKVISHTTWRNERMSLEANLAYQNNLREEHSEPLSHGYMPKPDGTLERRFCKHTATASFSTRYQFSEANTLRAGINGEYQHNRRGGWGFIIPDFETTSFGVYAIDRHEFGERLAVNAGMRYDVVRSDIHSYTDWYRTPTAAGDTVFQQRAADRRRTFNSLTWSAGVSYAPGLWVLKANVGKSFRVPIAKEMGADGINYHIFRYERGRADLDPEQAYQLDATLLWNNDVLSFQVEPYLNYFPNYIYLNPTASYVEGLQLYEYAQARVLRWGFEAEAQWHINRHWEARLAGEYLWARQRSGDKRGYTLPFSPPWKAGATLRYAFDWHGETSVSLNARLVGEQDEVVPPEKPTDGYWTLNLALAKTLPLRHTTLRLAIHADNLLDRRYYDHTSYYRLIDVPEPGRTLSAILAIDL